MGLDFEGKFMLDVDIIFCSKYNLKKNLIKGIPKTVMHLCVLKLVFP